MDALRDSAGDPCERARQWSVDIGRALRCDSSALLQASKGCAMDLEAVDLIRTMANSILGPAHTRHDFPTDAAALLDDFLDGSECYSWPSSQHSRTEESSASLVFPLLDDAGDRKRSMASFNPGAANLALMVRTQPESAAVQMGAVVAALAAPRTSNACALRGRQQSEAVKRAMQLLCATDSSSPDAWRPLNSRRASANAGLERSTGSVMRLSTAYLPHVLERSSNPDSMALPLPLFNMSHFLENDEPYDASCHCSSSDALSTDLLSAVLSSNSTLRRAPLQTGYLRTRTSTLMPQLPDMTKLQAPPSLAVAHSMSWHCRGGHRDRESTVSTVVEAWPVGKILKHGYSHLCALACQWDLINSFKLDKMLRRKSLVVMGYTLVQRNRKLDALGINFGKFANFVTCVQELYTAAPYHNTMHATHVTWAAHALLHMTSMAYVLDPKEMMAMYVAAICHDIGHKGTSSVFQIRTRSRSTLIFDQSPIENCHLALTSLLVDLKQNDFLENLSAAERTAFLSLIRRLVLGTDIALHDQILTEWRVRLPRLKVLAHCAAAVAVTVRGASPTAAAAAAAAQVQISDEKHAAGWGSCEGEQPKNILNQLNTATISDRELILMMLLKCADLSHTAVKTKIHLCWVARLEEEVWCQGDMEKTLGLECVGPADRDTGKGLQTTQVGFFSGFVMPLYTTFQDVFPATKKVRARAQANFEYWLSREEAAGDKADG